MYEQFVNWEHDDVYEVLKIAMEDLHSKKRQRQRIIDEVKKFVVKLPQEKQDAIYKSIADKQRTLTTGGDHEAAHADVNDKTAAILRSVDVVAKEDQVQVLLPPKEAKNTLCRFNDTVKPDDDDELTIKDATAEQIKRSEDTKVVSDFKKK